MSARPAYIRPDRIHLHGVWEPVWPCLDGRKVGVLLVRRWRRRHREPAVAPEGVTFAELRALHAQHAQHRLRFVDRADHVRILITDPSAPGRI